MDPKIKADWVAALRSGKYKQGRGVLRDTEGCHCCLGVLTDLAAKAGVVSWVEDDDADLEPDEVHPAEEFLPISAARWSGLNDASPRVHIEGPGRVSLVGLNDGEGGLAQRSFEELADLIEAQL